MPSPKPTPEQKAARQKTRDALRAEKKKEAKVTPQDKALNNLAENEKVPLLPLGFCNTLNLAFRHCGGIEAMIDLCAYCADECEEAGRVVIMYREVSPDDRKDLIPEDLCRKADISPARLLGVLAKAAFQRNIDMSRDVDGDAQPGSDCRLCEVRRAQGWSPGPQDAPPGGRRRADGWQ